MTFFESLRAGDFPVALEITPPQRPNPRILARRAGFLGESVRTINVIQRPGRQSSLDAAVYLAGTGFDPVWHLATRGKTLEELAAETASAVAGGVCQVLVVRGDHDADGLPDLLTIRAAAAYLSEHFPGLAVGATLNQYQLDHGRTLPNLLGKLDAGAAYIQTQPVFDARTFLDLIDRVKQKRPEIPVVPMAMPLLTSESADAIRTRLDIELPPTLLDILELGDEDAAWEHFSDTIAALREAHAVDGLALMTFEMDPVPDVARRIAAAIPSPATIAASPHSS